MSLIDRLRFAFNHKASAARTIATQTSIGQAKASPATYETFARRGYGANAIVFSCVNKIADACAGIEWELYQTRRGGTKIEVDENPLLTLMNRPNPMQGLPAFIKSVVGYYLLTGNSFIESVGETTPIELWPIRPDKMKIIPGKGGYPAAYVFDWQGSQKRWLVDAVDFKSQILHLKSFNPLDFWFGQSPLEAAILSMDRDNASGEWNLSMLRNEARPSGVLQMKLSDGNPRGELTEEQYQKLRHEFYSSYSGAKNAGRPMILEGGLEWSQISLSPKDMEYLESKKMTAHEIAMVYGIPDELLGSGQKTFNNYEEARLAFYEETVLPLMDFIKSEFNRWLAPAFGEGLELDYNRDDIEALTYKREKKFATIKDANFLTQNEKREAVGYEPVENWNVFLINNQLLESPEDMVSSAPFGAAPDVSGSEAEDEGEETPKPKTPSSDAEEIDEDAGSVDDGKSKSEIKFFNRLNRFEKVQSWKAQNRMRKQIEKRFSKELEGDFARMNRELVRAAKGALTPRLAEFAMLKAVDESMPDFGATIKRYVTLTLKDFGDEVFHGAKSAGIAYETKSAERRYNDYVKTYIDKRTGQAITEIQGTTKKKVISTVQKLVERATEEAQDGDADFSLGKFSDELQDSFDTLSRGRSNNIARTETMMASSAGLLNATKELQVPNLMKEWVSAEDDRVRDGEHGGADHAAANGQTVPLEDKFTVPPDASMDGPGDNTAGADQVCNCRCVLVFKVGGRD